jgi:serine protease Do
MRTHPSLPAAALLAAALLSPCAASAETVAGQAGAAPVSRSWNLRQTPIVDVVRRVRDAVVNIHSERTVRGPAAEELFALAPSQHRVNGMGTGILIDPRGYVITNQHVVEDVSLIRVRLADGTAATARVLARDGESDLALLKIDVARPLPVMPLGTAQDLMVGETVVAIGNAYGYEHTVTVGVVSAVSRDVTLNKEVSYKALIQTDASINPGNSGGPLLNIRGELVGVNVAIRAGAQGIGFAIPVDTMIRVAGQMLAGRAPLDRDGRRLGPVSAGLTARDEVRTSGSDAPPARTVLVDRLDASGPAARAGLRQGDVLVRVGDTAVACSLDVQRGLLDARAGDKVAVVFRREGAEQRAELAVEAGQVVPLTGDLVWRKLGLRLQAVNPETVSHSHPQLHGGLLIADVRPDGVAGKAGIQRGDVLVGLHQWEMLSVDNVLFVLNHPDLATIQPLRFYILRGGQVHRGWLQPVD